MSRNNWIYVFSFVLLLCSCRAEDAEPHELAPAAEELLELRTLDGELIQSGTPQASNGRLLAASQVRISERQVGDLTVFSEPLIQADAYPLMHTRQFKQDTREISFGKGNYPPLKVLAVGTPRCLSIEPVISQALPYQNEIHEKLSYKNLGISQGLNATSVYAIFQDSRGYFWFGGKRGITRYDGYDFQYYQLFSDDQQREVGAIQEDHSGNLWMSFGSYGGLIKFDGTHFYEYREGESLQVGEPYLGLLHTDKKGNIWLKAETSVIRYDGKTFTCFPYHFQNLKNLNIILKETSEGHLWLSALGGVCRIAGDEMTYFPIEAYGENNLCHPVTEDDRGLIITTGTGVTILKNDTLRSYPCPFMRDHELRGNLAVGFDFIVESEDRRSALFSITDSVLYVFSAHAPLFEGAYPMYVDRFQKIWFSTPGQGVQIYNPRGFKHFTFEKMNRGGHVASILEDREGNIWFGSHGFGLYKYNGFDHTYFPLTAGSNELAVRALIEDHEGSIWAGTVDSGLFKITNPQSSNPTITRYNCFGDSVYSVFSLTEDHEHNLWIGTRLNGLLCYDGQNFTQYFVQESAPINSPNNIRALLTDRDGNVWIGAQHGGVRKFDGSAFTWYTTREGLSSNQVVSLMEDRNGAIWIGTSDQGVVRMKAEELTAYSTADGLTSNAIWTINEDHAGNIWLGADNSLNVIPKAALDTPEKRLISIKTYRNMDGLEGAEFYANSGICDRSGRLWWGTEQMALMLSDPPSMLDQGDARITLEGVNIVNNRVDFKQLQDSIRAGKDWLLDAERELNLADIAFSSVSPFSNCPQDLELPPYLNDVTFIFSVSGTANPTDVTFSYFMEGVDKDWSIPTKSNKIDYRGLAAGTYTIQTRVAEVKGVWSEPVSYTFTVLPFWWQTWWAYLLWVALALGFLWLAFRLWSLRSQEREEAKRIREIEFMKSQFYANITHEFRTPLTLIMGMNAEISGHEKQKEIIQRNSEKLLHQINQLLETARLESGNLTLNPMQREIVHYLQFLAESFYNFAQDKGVRLTFYAEESSVIMDFDEEKIQGIVYNLLSNAIKFTPAGGSVIFHVSRENQKSTAYLKLKIKDSGIGIAEDQLSKIYQRFYQVDRIPHGNSGGTGIGLALTKDLIELMKGVIQVQSKPGSGTEFTVLIPISNQAPLAKSEAYQRPLGLTTPLQESLTELDTAASEELLQVLIIEDNKEIANYLVDLLKSAYQVQVAENGSLGLEKALALIPDAVISDIAMPGLSGYEVCETLKTDLRTSHIPVILLTAKVTQQDRVEGYRLGADAYLTKPFHREELEIILRKLIELRKNLQRRYAGTLPDAVEKTGIDEVEPSHNFVVEDAFIAKLNAILEHRLTDSEFGVPELAEAAAMTQMQVYRKLKALTNKTPSQFIRSARLRRAVELLKTTQLNVSEIAYEVGFSDPNYFSRTFHQEFGCPPAQYRK